MPQKWTKPKNALKEQIIDLHEQLDKEDVGTEEHDLLMTALERLYKIQKESKSDRIDGNAKATLAGNLLGIVLIMNHERLHVISTKALNFVKKT